MKYPSSISIFRGGFTLVELLIAVALLTLLMLTISRVFTITSKTVRVGVSKSAAVRALSGVQSVISQDLQGDGLGEKGIVPAREMPFLIISNLRVAALADEEDEASAATYRQVKDQLLDTQRDWTSREMERSRAVRTVDFDGDGVETPGEVVPLFTEGFRNYRVDSCSFFSRGSFQRQTGRFDLTGRDALVGNKLNVENAWVWYGHLKKAVGDPNTLFDPAGYAAPGELFSMPNAVGTTRRNANNLYANDFVLGRVVTLMRQPQRLSNNVVAVFDDADSAQWFAWPGSRDPTQPDQPAPPLSPLATGTPIASVTLNSANQGELRFIGRRSLRADEVQPTQAVTIEQGLVDIAGAGLAEMRRSVLAASAADRAWPSLVFGSHNRPDGGGRFWFNPFPETLPTSAMGTATSAYSAAWSSEQTKVLAARCPQFIVEFAGDFVSQADNASVTSAAPDGRMDFALIDGVRHIKWYGMPRDMDGDSKVLADRATISLDVQPLRDMLIGAAVNGQSLATYCISNGGVWQFNFESQVIAPPTGGQTDYLQIVQEFTPATGSTPSDSSSYVCAFGPAQFESRHYPKLIRFTIDCASPRNTESEPSRAVFTYSVR